MHIYYGHFWDCHSIPYRTVPFHCESILLTFRAYFPQSICKPMKSWTFQLASGLRAAAVSERANVLVQSIVLHEDSFSLEIQSFGIFARASASTHPWICQFIFHIFAQCTKLLNRIESNAKEKHESTKDGKSNSDNWLSVTHGVKREKKKTELQFIFFPCSSCFAFASRFLYLIGTYIERAV